VTLELKIGDLIQDCDPRTQLNGCARLGKIVAMTIGHAQVRWDKSGKMTDVRLDRIHDKTSSKKGYYLLQRTLPVPP
jgi:hypothetical protein